MTISGNRSTDGSAGLGDFRIDMVCCTAVCQLNINSESHGRVEIAIIDENIVEFYVCKEF